MNPLRPLYFWLVHALRGIRAALAMELASTATIALTLLLLGVALLGLVNLDRLTRTWGRGVQVVLYLAPEAPKERVAALFRTLRQRPEVATARWVSSKQAFARLKQSLGNQGALLEGVEPNFLPASIELSLRAERPGAARALLALLRTSSLVQEVDHMGSWARRLDALVGGLRLLALGLALVVAAACLYIVFSTIRLGVHARREEIEIQKLVGATDRFVRAPFMIEGALQGLCGAALAAGLLYGLYAAARPRLQGLLQSSLNELDLTFLPPSLLLAGLGLGTLLGLLGSRLALGRYTGV